MNAKPGITALWRPGGCINTRKFIPLFHQYMEKGLAHGLIQKVKPEIVLLSNMANRWMALPLIMQIPTAVLAYKLAQLLNKIKILIIKAKAIHFCPGEEVGLLSRFGLDEPAYASFAGAVLFLELPIPNDSN